MAFAADLDIIRAVASRDTAIAKTDPNDRARALDEMAAIARTGNRDDFLLEAMKVFALAGNGHTRLVPNPAIRVLPLRLVWAGPGLWSCHEVPRRVVAINETPVEDAFGRLRPHLAGTPARQRVVGALPLVWPGALRRLGNAAESGAITFQFADGTAQSFDADRTIPAETKYPVFETGTPDPARDPYRRETNDLCVLRLASFSNSFPGEADQRVIKSCKLLGQRALRPIVIDLRGNPGGDFLAHLGILDRIAEKDASARVTVLVDRFTFSAAVVFAALCRHRFAARIVGEDMGDAGQFHAEGGTEKLPDTGSLVRWSDGYHDWTHGVPSAETPPEIAAEMVACGALDPDIKAVTTPEDLSLGRDPALDAACHPIETPGQSA
ncbi:MAG: hypothetical protein HKN18_04490 [Silicimonas sp.]|nr:hypothetical protein [Silicimonas sp.]